MQAVSHHTAGCRTASGTYAHTEFFSRTANKVHHYKEIPRETHRLHYVQFKADTLFEGLVVFKPIFAVTLERTLHSQVFEVVGLKFDTIQAVVAAKFLYFLLCLFFVHHHLAFFVAGELVKELLLGKPLAV